MLSLNKFIHQSFINYTKKRFNLTIDELSASKFLKDSTISGLIAHDINDNVVLFEEGKKISNSWKKAKFIQTEGLGHSMHNEHLYQTIVEFVND